MRNEKALLFLVVVDVFLVFAVIVTEFVLHKTLPASLQEYVLAQYLGSWTAATIVYMVAWLAIAAATVVAWIGLLNYWKHAPHLYLAASVALVVLRAVAGPSVWSGPGTALDTAECLVGGAILGLVYFSDLRSRFGRKTEPGPGFVHSPAAASMAPR